ncbi:MAG: response regulator [Lachnospiraceae bacterium]|nr:response regulator [Lachnospiraceae bacterium]
MKVQRKKTIECILGGILCVVLLYLVLGEIFGTQEITMDEGTCGVLQTSWERVYEDGTREPVTLPGVWNEEPKKAVRAEAVLPELQDGIYGCMRASQQDVWIYVGGELRKEYSTKDTRPFGKTSASAYVFFPLYEEDAGKVLAVVTVSDSEYSGRMSQITVGTKQDIISSYLRGSGLLMLVAFTTVILSMVTVVVSLVLCIIHKKEVDIIYLGLGSLITSLIMLAESSIRQFFLPNITVASNVGFFLTMLAPYPFVIYANRIQKQRYQKFLFPILILVIVNIVGSFSLHVFGIVDFMDSMITDYVIIGLALVIGSGTLIADIVNKHIRDYWEVGIGLIGVILASAWEIYQVYDPGVKKGGFAFCTGLCFLLVMAAFKTGRDMQALEKEKQRAIVTGEAKAQFLAQMSHEIRTPINTIIGMNEMILRENKDESVKEYADNIAGSSRMLLGLINDILDFSKIDAGKLELTIGSYETAKLFDTVVQELKFKANLKGLRVIVERDTALPECLVGDEIRIRQILTNLMSNAIKYTKEGTVTFKVKGMEDEGVFSLVMLVEDTGIGIRKEDIPRLFQSFQRMEERKHRHIEGTGLGLAITKQLTELMNGHISVRSEYGKGTCFTVVIPQKISDRSKQTEMNTTAKNVNEKTEVKKMLYAPKAEILAVDDNAMNLRVVQMLLKRTGIQIDVAPGGEECLQMCRRKKYDLILMDHMMPDLDGIETLRLLRQEKENLNAETEVIVLTANAIAGSEEQYLAEGFAGYLSKPLVPDELEKMLTAHLPKEKLEDREEE